MSGLPFARYMQLSRDMSLKLTPEDHAAAGGFLHFCDEWDGLLIDRTDDEFDCCSCTFTGEFDPATGKLAAQGIEARQGGDVEQAPREARKPGPKDAPQ